MRLVYLMDESGFAYYGCSIVTNHLLTKFVVHVFALNATDTFYSALMLTQKKKTDHLRKSGTYHSAYPLRLVMSKQQLHICISHCRHVTYCRLNTALLCIHHHT